MYNIYICMYMSGRSCGYYSFIASKNTLRQQDHSTEVGIKYDRAQDLEDSGVYTIKADLNDRSIWD
jgi:hypothetical protein